MVNGSITTRHMEDFIPFSNSSIATTGKIEVGFRSSEKDTMLVKGITF